MTTINVVNGAKYLFDVTFTVPAFANFGTIEISDVLALGFDSTETVAEITLSDGAEPIINPDSVTCIVEDPDGAPGVKTLRFVTTDPRIVNPAVDTLITATFPVFVTDADALIAEGTVDNRAEIMADDNTPVPVTTQFTVEPALLSVFTKKAAIQNNNTDIAAVVVSFPALDSQPITTTTDYTLTVNLSGLLNDPVPGDKTASEQAVQGYLQIDGEENPALDPVTDFVASYTLRVDDETGGIMEITIYQKETFKNHTLYFYFPTTLVTPFPAGTIPQPPFIGSAVTLTSGLDLNDSNIHLTEIVSGPPVISPGGKVIR